MRIVWAFDPFVEEKSLQRTAFSAIQALLEIMPGVVEPVYVFGPSLLDVPDPRFPFSEGQLRTAVETGLEGILGEIRIPSMRKPVILRSRDQLLKHEADLLVEHARQSGADLIVVSTHAKKGIDRWMLGSFAETLLHRSDVPVLAVNPYWDRAADLREILYPTDFSDESRAALSEVARFARAAGSRVLLYHRLQMPVIPNADILVSSYFSASSYIQEEIALKENELIDWAKELKAEGVEAEVLLDSDTSVGVPQGILNTALERNVSVIAMAAHSGRLRGLLGSTTRKVLRSSTSMVWVMYPDAEGKVVAHHELRVKGSSQERQDDRPIPGPI